MFDIRLWEVGAKRNLIGNSKVNRQTNRRTDGRTFPLKETIGSKGQCFENIYIYQIKTKTNRSVKLNIFNKYIYYHENVVDLFTWSV